MVHSYVATYNKGVAKELQSTVIDQEKDRVEMMRDRLEANWQRLQSAGVLYGLTIHSRQDCIGTCCVSGAEDAIQKLKSFIEGNELGFVFPNEEIMRSAAETE